MLQKEFSAKSVLILIFVFTLNQCNAESKADEYNCGLSHYGKDEFYCTNFKGILPVNCSKTTLYSMNKQTYKLNVNELKIGGCSDTTVTSHIRNYRYLKTLDISYSGIDHLYLSKTNVEQLKTLNVSHNRFKEIPSNFLSTLPQIERVDFSHNQLTEVSDLPEDLIYINLSYNNISTIKHDEFFKSMYLQRDLYLEGNPIEIFDWKMLPLIKRNVHLYMSWKQLIEFKIWEPLFRPIHVVSNSQIEGIFPSANKSIALHCNEGSFENLVVFEFVENIIENPTEMINCLTSSIESITFSGQFIQKLETNSFERFNKLKILRLPDAQLNEFDFIILNKMPNLEWLDISQNKLQIVRTISSLEHVTNLKHLNVVDCQMESTPEIIEYLSPSIEYLHLGGNHVGKLNETSFKKFKNLKTLILTKTNFSVFDLKVFEPMTQLEILDISYNNLSSLEFGSTFEPLGQLKIFKAIDCNIQNASQIVKLIENSQFLNTLDLSGNNISELNPDLFNNFEELQHLYLMKTNLKKINLDILKNKYKLHTLDLSYNHLETIDFLHVLSDLKIIYLQNNNLKEITNLKELRLPQLSQLDISENKFSCSILGPYESNFKSDWPLIKLKSDLWKATSGENCGSNEVK